MPIGTEDKKLAAITRPSVALWNRSPMRIIGPAIPCISYPETLKYVAKRINKRFSVGSEGPYDFYLGIHGFNQPFMKYKPAFQYGLLKPEKPSSKADSKWSIRHDDLYDSFTGIVKAMHYHKGACYNIGKQHSSISKNRSISCFLIYPLVIFSGDVFTCKVSNDGKLDIKKAKDVFLYKRHSSKTIRDVFPIFVITEKDIESFLKNVDTNFKIAIDITTNMYFNGKGKVRPQGSIEDGLKEIFAEPSNRKRKSSRRQRKTGKDN